jgi:hypothetical protein
MINTPSKDSTRLHLTPEERPTEVPFTATKSSHLISPSKLSFITGLHVEAVGWKGRNQVKGARLQLDVKASSL